MSGILFYLYLASMAVSAILATIYFSGIRPRRIGILMPYLWYILLAESVLAYAQISSTAIYYNFYQPLTVLVFFTIYYRIPIMQRYRKWMLALLLIYLVAVVINYTFFESIRVTGSYMASARGFVIVSFAVLFLFAYFSLDNLEVEKFWHPLVWITAGIVIFYPVVSVSIAFHKYLAALQATFYGLKLYQVIPRVMSLLMYSCFSYAFYLCRKKT